MKRLFAAFDGFWYRPAPPERLAMLRLLVGAFALVILLVRLPSLSSVTGFHAGEFAPVGPVVVLGQPLAPVLVYASLVATMLAGAAFVAGFRYRVAGPLFALSFLWVTSYRASWGMKFHTENLVALHLLLLALAPAADALSFDARGTAPSQAHGRYGWAIQAMCAVTLVTYALAGVAKLKLAGFEWANGDVLRSQVAYDNLRKIELGSFHSPLGVALARWGWPFLPLSAATLLLELAAPLALVGGRVARGWALSAWAFHVGVLALMAIAFPYPLSFIAYASFFEVERLLLSRPYLSLKRRLRLS